MLISYSWLKDYVDVKLPPEKLADTLTMAGLTVASVKESGGDHIIEIEVTANRPDWLSYVGVAREIAAITGRKLKVPAVNKKSAGANNQDIEVKIRVEDKALCPRYTARVIRNVKIGNSPDYLVRKLAAMGLKTVNNIVDITNFCLFETGEPLHAFDLDKISGGEVIIRKAKKGEKIITIDGTEKALDETMLVITDRDKPIAVAGVMGGINTEVTASTKNILLEAAYFDPVSVRRTARKLGISTESSYRFERRVDEDNIVYSSERAASLIKEVALGDKGKFFDIGGKTAKKAKIILRKGRLIKIIGEEISTSKAKTILSSLGVKTNISSKDNIECIAPSFRYDLKNEIDLIEEVVRIYGYANIPMTIPGIVEQPLRKSPALMVESNIRRSLIASGADEIITYTLVGKSLINRAGISDEELVQIKNPLTSEQEFMPPSLMTGMLSIMMWNINRKNKDLKLFEIGNVYRKRGADKFSEEKFLSIGITGHSAEEWAVKMRSYNFFDLKGMVESILRNLNINNYEFSSSESKIFSQSAAIKIKGETAGLIGEVRDDISGNFDIKNKVCIAEIAISPLIRHASLNNRVKELPKYPTVARDISILVDKNVTNRDVISSIKDASSPILKEIQVVDRYSGEQVPKDKVSITYRLEYQDPLRTLEEKDVTEAHSKIVRALEEKLGAKLR